VIRRLRPGLRGSGPFVQLRVRTVDFGGVEVSVPVAVAGR